MIRPPGGPRETKPLHGHRRRRFKGQLATCLVLGGARAPWPKASSGLVTSRRRSALLLDVLEGGEVNVDAGAHRGADVEALRQ